MTTPTVPLRLAFVLTRPGPTAALPVLVVFGADDVHAPGHLPGVEQPERFNAALPEFLAARV
ncbi:hypothetical protein [Streptomyces marokkonensis]|uniref:hypothetical protein n=1 Tax=Streptomyces marokkonensis TaxID=324855 RepID=UPI0031EEF5A6